MRVSCLVLLAACGGASPRPVTPVTPVEPATSDIETTAPGDPADTPERPTSHAVVTSQMLADAYQQVSVLGTWDEVLANFTNRIGAPTSVGKSPIGSSPDTRMWALVDDDACYLLTLSTNPQGNTEANYGSFQRGRYLFDECSAVAAKR